MFGYKYGMTTDDKGNKILNLSVSLDYLATFSNYKDEIDAAKVEDILDFINPIGAII